MHLDPYTSKLDIEARYRDLSREAEQRRLVKAAREHSSRPFFLSRWARALVSALRALHHLIWVKPFAQNDVPKTSQPLDELFKAQTVHRSKCSK